MMQFIFLVVISLIVSVFLVSTAEYPDYDPFKLSKNFHKLRLDQNLYEVVKDNIGTVVLFIAPWCEDSKRIKNLLDEKCDRSIVVVDDRHPDSSFVKDFPGIYIYDGKILKKQSIKDIFNIFN